MPNLNLAVIPLDRIDYIEDDHAVRGSDGSHINRINVFIKDRKEPYIAIGNEAVEIYESYIKFLSSNLMPYPKRLSVK